MRQFTLYKCDSSPSPNATAHLDGEALADPDVGAARPALREQHVHAHVHCARATNWLINFIDKLVESYHLAIITASCTQLIDTSVLGNQLATKTTTHPPAGGGC